MGSLNFGNEKIAGATEGKHFSSSEGLQMAKSWISQSMKGTYQTKDSMREGFVENVYQNVSMDGSPSALKSNWSSFEEM